MPHWSYIITVSWITVGDSRQPATPGTTRGLPKWYDRRDWRRESYYYDYVDTKLTSPFTTSKVSVDEVDKQLLCR